MQPTPQPSSDVIYHVTSQVGGGATASLRTGWGAPRSPHVAGRVRVCVAAAGVVCCLAAGCTSSDDHGGSTPQLSPIDRLVEKYRADGRDVQCVVAQLERLDEAEVADFADLVVPEPGVWHDVVFTPAMRDVTKQIETC